MMIRRPLDDFGDVSIMLFLKKYKQVRLLNGSIRCTVPDYAGCLLSASATLVVLPCLSWGIVVLLASQCSERRILLSSNEAPAAAETPRIKRTVFCCL